MNTATAIELFEQWSGEKPLEIKILPESASYRRYYRLIGNSHRALAAHNADLKENTAFVEFTRFFLSKGLRVPQLYAIAPSRSWYLIEDLGDITLYTLVERAKADGTFPDAVVALYEQALSHLLDIQFSGCQELTESVFYPRALFDAQSMRWDLHYFKYHFLKVLKVPFDEQRLEEDFETLIAFLGEAENDFFLFRDFQSRNIMVKDGLVYFIDYQGGRRGALSYDVASLLFDAKVGLPHEVRQNLLEFYCRRLAARDEKLEAGFRRYYAGYSLIRILQALAAFGFRGLVEKKEHFIRSIPNGVENLAYWRTFFNLRFDLPELNKCINYIVDSESIRRVGLPESLRVSINSFSYRRGIPVDETGNGGGYVFDCRCLPNPGRLSEFAQLTGRDQPVIDFLCAEAAVQTYIGLACQLVATHVEDYIARGLTHLVVNFGCTGGQHRSVYCAEQLADFLKKNYDVQVRLRHREQEMRTGQGTLNF